MRQAARSAPPVNAHRRVASDCSDFRVTVGDRTRFVREDEQWERFIELLDRPPPDSPGLAKLFSRSRVFAERSDTRSAHGEA